VTEAELRAKTLRDYEELGARQMQVVQLRRALRDYGQHRDYCTQRFGGDRCNCGMAEALRIGTGAEAACGLMEER
jgi:hypothetical protein